MRWLIKLVTVLGVTWSCAAGGEQFDAPLADGEGIINDLNFARYTITIGGYEYRMTDTTKVEIAGSYGAFTMLRKGMAVEFSFLRFDDGVRRITEIYEVAEVVGY